VNNVGTVVVNGETKGSVDYSWTEDGKLFTTSGTADWSTWTSSAGAATVWPEGRQNVRVTYDHGYVSGTTVDVPNDVRMVALSVAERLVLQGPVILETIGDVTVRWSTNQLDLTDGEKAILAKYR
jgi:hypothetical protein